MGELNEKHRADLRSSGLTDETIAASGCYSADTATVRAILGFDAGPGLVFSYPGTLENGSGPYQRVKPDAPFPGENGKPAKYLSPKREKNPTGNRMYFPAILPASVLSDVSVPLLVTEGEKKALAAVQNCFMTIAISGVTCWKTRDGDGEPRPIADLDRIAWAGRVAYIAFDSDASRKPEVRRQEWKLSQELVRRGARARVVRLPEPTEDECRLHGLQHKFGVDDFLMARGKAAFQALLKQSKAPRRSRMQSDDEEKPKYVDVAHRLIHDLGFNETEGLKLRFWRGDFYQWNGSRYSAMTGDDIFALVMRYLQKSADMQRHCSRHFVSNIIANLQGICQVEAKVVPPMWLETHGGPDPKRCIGMTNGILNLGALLAGGDEVLLPCSPRFFTVASLGYDFDPTAKCPVWLQVIDRILPDRVCQELLQEWFGYCVIHENAAQRYVVFVGEGDNGKSLVAKTLVLLLGEENCSSVPIEHFRGNHNLHQTLGKLVNIAPEFEELDKATEGTVKAFVAADAMEFNPKFKPPFTAVPTAKLLVLTNGLPHFRDRSLGLWKRTIPLRFDVRIPVPDQDKRLPEKLLEERAGILNWALLGLHRYLVREAFQLPGSSQELLADHRRSCNSARAFIEEHLVLHPGGVLPKQSVYEDYAASCRERGNEAYNEANFAKEVGRYFEGGVRATRRRVPGANLRKHVYVGMGWARDESSSDERETHPESASIRASEEITR